MKFISILFCTIIFSNLAFSQDFNEDINQADSIYKINKIKSRTLRYLNDNLSIKYDYSIDGKLLSKSDLLKDSQLLSKTNYFYNSSGKLIREEEDAFFKTDTFGKDISYYESLDRTKKCITIFNYSESGELVQKTTVDNKNEKTTEVSFYQDRRIKKDFHYNSNSYDSTIIEYEKPNFVKHATVYLIYKDHILKASEISYTNHFNKNGRIEKRTAFNIISNREIKASEENYKYGKSGLLISKTGKSFFKQKEFTRKLLFKYDYR